MQIPLLAIFFCLAAATLASGYWVLVGVPRNLTSMFRYRLWRLRDEMVDGIISGKLEDTPELRQFISHVETTIRLAPMMTPFRLGVMVLSLVAGPAFRRETRNPARKIPESMSRQYDQLFGNLFLVHLLSGSVSGWLCSLLLFGIVMPIAKVSNRAKVVWTALQDAATSLSQAVPAGMRVTTGNRALASCV